MPRVVKKHVRHCLITRLIHARVQLTIRTDDKDGIADDNVHSLDRMAYLDRDSGAIPYLDRERELARARPPTIVKLLARPSILSK